MCCLEKGFLRISQNCATIDVEHQLVLEKVHGFLGIDCYGIEPKPTYKLVGPQTLVSAILLPLCRGNGSTNTSLMTKLIVLYL